MSSRRLCLAALALLSASAAHADSTVSALTAASALTGPELFYCVQSAADRKCTATQLQTFIGGGTPTFPVTVAGTVTSGGIPYFSSTTVESSSGLLTANALIVGGGAGLAPSTITTGAGVVTALGVATNASGGMMALAATTAGTLGYWNGSSWTTLTGNTSGTQCLQETAAGVPSWGACGGGGGTPGGSTTQLQYNNAGAFGGISNVTTNGTALTELSFATSSSSTTFVIHGSSFTTTGINIDPSAKINMGGDGVGISFSVGDGIGVRYSGSGITWIQQSGTDSATSAWVNVGVSNTSGIIEQRRTTVPQTYRVYNTTDTSAVNFERGVIDWTTTGSTFTIGTQMGGTGLARPMMLVQTGLYSAAGTALPTCVAGLKGARTVVSDATAPTYNANYASGGAITANVLCNGSNWVTQ
jgi:hypothetical protein